MFLSEFILSIRISPDDAFCTVQLILPTHTKSWSSSTIPLQFHLLTVLKNSSLVNESSFLSTFVIFKFWLTYLSVGLAVLHRISTQTFYLFKSTDTTMYIIKYSDFLNLRLCGKKRGLIHPDASLVILTEVHINYTQFSYKLQIGGFVN